MKKNEIKTMILIQVTDGSKYWTDSYSESEDGWVEFNTKSKAGVVAKHRIKKLNIIEFMETEVGGEKGDKLVDNESETI